MAIEQLALSKLRIDGGTQQRAKIDLEVVADYAEKLADLPPVTVYFDGSDYWLAGGFHRYHAAAKAEKKKIPCDVRKGTQRDAILFSCGDNATHGLKRSNADKRKAVAALLKDPEWAKASDRWIAETCVVSVDLVGDVRRQLTVDSDSQTVQKRTGRDGRTTNTAPIAAAAKERAEERKAERDAEEPDDEPESAADPVNEDSEPEPEVIAKPAKPGQPKVDVRKFADLESKVGAVVRANTALKDHCGGAHFHEQIRQHLNGILKEIKAWRKDKL